MKKYLLAGAGATTLASLVVAGMLAARAEAPLADFGEESPALPRGPRVEIVAVGDIMPARWVERRLRRHGYGYAFASTSEVLRSAQVSFANLESPLVAGEPVEAFQMVFRGDPEFAGALAEAGIDVASVANNHAGDQGPEGLESTVEALAAAGVRAVGAGRDLTSSRSPVVVKTSTGSVAFLAYADTRWIPGRYVAGDGYGVAPLDPTLIREDVARAAELADFVVVSMHAGTEYETGPDSVQRDAAEAAASAGAALVIGHNPHVLQPIEKIGATVVAWSLGNFIFDQDISPETQESVIARFELSENGVEASVLPAIIVDYAQPRPTSGEAARETAEKLLGAATPCAGRASWWCPQKENAD